MPDPQSHLKSLMLAIAKAVSISSTLLFSVLITIYFSGKTIPELKPPIAMEDGGWLADGGTMWLMLKDAEGKQFLLGVNGSMDRSPSEFPVVVQRWYSWEPLPVTCPCEAMTSGHFWMRSITG